MSSQGQAAATEPASLASVTLGRPSSDLPVISEPPKLNVGYPNFSGDPGGSASSGPPRSEGFRSSAGSAAPDKAGVEAVLAGVLPHIQNYSSLLRPWGNFFIMRRPEPGQNIRAHAEKNLQHFQANYLFIVSGYLIVVVLQYGAFVHFLATAAAVAMWALYLRRGGFDPSWTPVVMGVELTASQRLYGMVAASTMLLLLVLGQSLLWLIGIPAIFIAAHAILHPGAAAVGDYTSMAEADFGL
mmetsp:Transcript_44415/g.105223  ORF Transcript_44415/g.105223 Transcript_44415/m.105223 type:complete len:242 (+) Transcript_44415:118-843(+)